ncbi:conserved hypothetical protein [Prochlorococcus marinus str. MIT 9515]|uniref:Ycf66-like protein n=1 Tax=Prochlorococcus marinus (strain MIT 9515) TaxID=167542 RepID=A2BU20_PROM5|nr:Ycf66 family protein [Prochlorococcus marinus]ABM71281.1 conserved hypothetical protein [Prochlorococcus marinus str. MIT 9515]
MVNASLNWASIVGIVLAVCGGGLYFLRSFKPALARDYDVFFAAIGLLCGGILFFQGWRLDPILQFGQFLLAGTTVFFAYESVRLRGVATDQARRSSYFEDDQIPDMPRNSSRNRFNDDYDRFDDSDRIARRFKPQEDDIEEDYIEGRSQRRNISRAIPESAVSRRRPPLRESNKFENEEPKRRRNRSEDRMPNEERRASFGERRASRSDVKRGSRPLPNKEVSRKLNNSSLKDSFSSTKTTRQSIRSQIPREKVEDASFSQNINEEKKTRQARRSSSNDRSTSKNQAGRYTVGTKKNKSRDNSSRFDD